MKLIADSGSTKTSWAVVDDKETKMIGTAGINPAVQSEDTIMCTLHEMVSILTEGPCEIYFYGAGCRGKASLLMEQCLRQAFPDAETICVESDLLGAARALFGGEEGIACILGTGSNSCLYDGKVITANVPPLGYILGDEGSGASLGKMFFNALFKGDLPEELKNMYLEETNQTYDDVIRRVYREQNANRYLASTSLFLANHLDLRQLVDIVEQNFEQFFVKNVRKYGRPDLLVAAVGSIAFAYSDLFNKVAACHGYQVTRVIKEPIDALVGYHAN
jgi:N-acetylglucosamine kinase-like BadF-type ATPase